MHNQEPSNNRIFHTTQWSVVLSAANPDAVQARGALEHLCRIYWYPIYAYIRRKGFSAEDGQDLTQSFFEHLLKREFLRHISPEKGKFRSFLQASLNYFLSDYRDRIGAVKRGGGAQIIPLDFMEAENRYRYEPQEAMGPDKLFERKWAQALLDQVLSRLEEEFKKAGKAELFRQLSVHMVEGVKEQTYGATGKSLGQSEESVKKAVHRMRRRYYQLFRSEIAHTVADEGEVEEELRYLCGVVAS